MGFRFAEVAVAARRRWPWLALVALSVALHLWGLGERSFHHDEAIHAHSAYNLLKNGIYRYDPTYHGPVLYYLTVSSYALLGDSDFSARLPIALCGVLLIAVAWCLRRPFGERAAWWTGLLVTVSPSFLYYGRFLRMDTLELLVASAAFVAVWRAARGRPAGWPWLGVFTGLAFATKENAFVTAALVGAVWAAWAGLRVLGGSWQAFVDWVRTAEGAARGSLAGRVLAGQWRELRRFVAATAAWLWRHRWGIGTSIAAAVAVTVPLFTVGFRYPGDWFFPGRAIAYWWGQHEIARVAGPWWYHLPRLVLYDFLVLAAAAVWLVRRRRRLTGVELALALFGVLSIGIYAYLREKVPWLGVHQVWAFLPLAGAQLARTFSRRGRWWSRTLAAAGLAVTGYFSIAANFFWSEISPNLPHAEALLYVQTSPDLKPIVEEGYRLRDAGVDPVAAVDGEAGWPLTWYWRTTPTRWSQPPAGMRPPIVLCDPEDEAEVRRVLGPGYSSRRLPLRSWWLMQDWTPSPYELLRYVAVRIPWGVVGSSDVVALERLDDDLPAMRDAQVPAALAAALPVTSARVVGEGWLAGPRGISVRGDGLLAVADTVASQVVLFDRDGVRQEVEFGTELREPEAVAWTPDGMLAIADTWNHRALLYDSTSGSLVPLPAPDGGWYGPRGVAVASTGAVAFTDTGNKRLVLMDSRAGEVRTTVLGGEGGAPGRFVEPGGVAWLDDRRLVVCDTGNHRLQVIDRGGRALEQVALPDAWSDFYSRPQVVAVGDLWLASDTPASTLWLVRDGRPERIELAAAGIAPTGLAVEGSRLYVADGAGRVWVFDLDLDS